MVQSRLVAFLVIRILALKPIKTAFNRAEITNGCQRDCLRHRSIPVAPLLHARLHWLRLRSSRMPRLSRLIRLRCDVLPHASTMQPPRRSGNLVHTLDERKQLRRMLSRLRFHRRTTSSEKPKNSKPEQDGLRSKSEKESASRALRERVACSENMS